MNMGEPDERCPVCGQLCSEKIKSIRCGMCSKRCHFHCFESGKLTQEVLKVIKYHPNVVKIVCRSCAPANISGKIIPANPNEDASRMQQLAVEKSRAAVAVEEANRAKEESNRIKQRNTQLMVEHSQLMAEKTIAGDHIGSLNAKIHDLQKSNAEKDKEIVTFLNTTAASALNPGKRPRTEERSASAGHSHAPELMQNSFSIEILDRIIQRALGPMQIQIESIMSQLRTRTVIQEGQRPTGRQPTRNNYQGPRPQSQVQQPSLQAQRQQSEAQRQQSQSRPRASTNLKKKSFAEVVNQNKNKIDSIRNIKINLEEPDRIDEINKKLDRLNIEGVQIQSIARKAKDFLTVKCVKAADAVVVEEQLTIAFGDKLVISGVKSSTPRVKIVDVGLDPDTEIENDYFVSLLKSQNYWLRNMNFKVTEVFKVPGSKRDYSNVILDCDILALKAFLEKGSVIVGFAEKRVYEHINILQCFNCQRFGHVVASCKVPPTCRFCASTSHPSRECEDKSIKVCANCLRANKKGAKHNALHRASDERCPSRAARILALKALAAKN